MTSVVDDHEHHAALALFAFGFSIPTIMLRVASFRTNVVVVAAIAVLLATCSFSVPGSTRPIWRPTRSSRPPGGWVWWQRALAIYLTCAEVCEFTYGRAIIPLGPLGRA